MKTSYQRTNLSRHPRVIIARIKQAWPIFIWMAAVAGVALLYTHTDNFTSMTGAVVTIVEPVAPLQSGRLLSLEVTLGQRVAAGDILAVMDSSLLDARLSVEEARIIEAEETVSGFEQGMMRLALDADTAQHRATLDLQQAIIDHKSRQAELNEMQRELARQDDLLKRGLADADAGSSLKPQIASLEKEIELFPEIEAIGRKRLEGATQQMDALKVSLEMDDNDTVLATIRERAQAQRGVLRASLKKRLLEKDTYVLKARRDGIVSRIFAMPGDVMGAGDVILRLVSEDSNAIEGFLPETYVSSLMIGQEVEVMRLTGIGGCEATVTAIAPEIQTLPGRASPIRNQPIRGRRIMFAIQGEHSMIPGETVRIVAR